MNLAVTVVTESAEAALDGLEAAVKRADRRAVVAAARVAVLAVRRNAAFVGPSAPEGQLGRRTGRLARQIKAVYFQQKDGLRGAAVRVKGDRAHIARFNELGTASHGRAGGPLPARKLFEITGRAISKQLASTYKTAFDLNFRVNIVGF